MFRGFAAYPRQRIGAYSYSWSHITPEVGEIGRYCSIAADVQFGHTEHPTRWISTSSFTYDKSFMGPNSSEGIQCSRYTPAMLPVEKKRAPIIICNDVWIGMRSYVRGGVTLNNGCIVGANAVVTKDVPAYAIVVGNPARIVGYRFENAIIAELLALKWWDYSFTDFEGVDVTRPDAAIEQIQNLLKSGMQPYRPMLRKLAGDSQRIWDVDETEIPTMISN
ncbi:CatB-related O-acetyltransferase [Methylobacterium sp. J-092]|uniref:CatB-related O-acetyltransferase n=1 Tax=Methylobacterium sp. J-092 TaxID=2836667 RepID=UPI001FB8E7BA|nr:CatB-related O-acetyltransferase [Methylobacterium sp. J-092]MCJ2006656.1 CatB-related O-acetyltransferase [Methylobacterium sp. J-092]